MADNFRDRAPEDAKRISLKEDWEVKYWTKKLGISETKLKRLVKEHGPLASTVKAAAKANVKSGQSKTRAKSTTLEKRLTSLVEMAEERLVASIDLIKTVRLTSAAFPSIVSTPGVCGGDARIIRTRIPVWSIERMRQLGMTDVEILANYPTLHAADLVASWAYADAHRDEIEQAIRANEED